MLRPWQALRPCALAWLLSLAACGGGGASAGAVSSGLTGGAGNPAVDGDTRNDGMSSSELSDATSLASGINTERRAAGVRELAFHATASWAAYWHSVDMQELGFFDHVNPKGQDPFDRLQAVGVTGLRGVDEIIARAPASTSPSLLTYQLVSSAEHRRQLLDPDWTHIAVGVHFFVEAGTTTKYWTVMFMAR